MTDGKVKIRESDQSDKTHIRTVHQNAFGAAEGPAVSRLAVELLEDESARPVLSLVAEKGDELVASIIFSSIRLEGGGPVSAYILAPLAVAGQHQGCGIGTELIRQGLQALKSRGAEFVLVLGDPNYYSRAGFSAGHGLRPPYPLAYPEAWMARELVEGALTDVQGKVLCAATLMAPEHW